MEKKHIYVCVLIIVITISLTITALAISHYTSHSQDVKSTSSTSSVHEYAVNVSGSNYQILNGATNTVLYQSTSSSAAINYLLGPTGIAQSGNTIYVKTGTYTVDATWNIAISGITITFQSGATLTASNNYNAGYHAINISGNNIIVTGLTLNGNGLNMYPSPTTTLSGDPNTYNQMLDGIGFSGSNCLIENSIIHNIRVFGVESSGNNNGVINCTIYDVGANGITFEGMDDYAINNNVYHFSDVGIDSWGGKNALFTGNYIHDSSAALATMYGWMNGYWGIGIEGSGGSGKENYLIISRNTITNIQDGIAVADSNYVLISGNTITNSGWEGIWLYSSSGNSIIEFNIIRNACYGIDVTEAGSNNIQYGNIFSNISSQNIYGTISNYQPSTVTVIYKKENLIITTR